MSEWPPLPKGNDPPKFPLECLFSPMPEMVEAVAASIQVHSDMAANFAIGALLVAVNGKVKVRMWDGYDEPLQEYMAVCAEPSEGKSPAMSAFFRPIYSWEATEKARMAGAVAESIAKRRLLERKLEQAYKKSDETLAVQYQQELSEHKDVHPLRIILTDATTEAASKAAGENEGQIAIGSDEGAILGTLAGGYSKEGIANIDFFLQAWSAGYVHIERVGRAPVHIERACLSMVLAVQPGILSSFLSNQVLLGRGLCARFLYAKPPSLIGYRDAWNAKPIPPVVSQAYTARLFQLLDIQRRKEPITLTLSPEALEYWRKWKHEIEVRIGAGGDWNKVLNGWEGKLAGRTARMAGLLRLMDNPDPAQEIGAKHMTAAIEIARYYVGQVLALTNHDSRLSSDAHEVLAEIIKQGQEIFSPYALRQRLRKRKRFENGQVVDAALLDLQNNGYLRQGTQPEWNGIGRPPEYLYEVHPGLFPSADVVEVEI